MNIIKSIIEDLPRELNVHICKSLTCLEAFDFGCTSKTMLNAIKDNSLGLVSIQITLSDLLNININFLNYFLTARDAVFSCTRRSLSAKLGLCYGMLYFKFQLISTSCNCRCRNLLNLNNAGTTLKNYIYMAE